MSVPVPLDELATAVERHGTMPYLLTTGGDGRPHAVAAAVGWADGRLRVAAGRRTQANVAERPLVSLLWPPPAPGGLTLLVDGEAEVEDGEVAVSPTSAVLHRAAR